MVMDAERSAFEAYTREHWPEAPQDFERDGDGYRQFMLNTAWLGWRARALRSTVDWNYDMKAARANKAIALGVQVFGCDAGGRVAVMHWRDGSWVIPAGKHKWDAFAPVGWMEIPPVNLAV